MFFHSYCITWQNTLFFFQKFQSLRKRPVHRLFGWRICTIKSFRRKRSFSDRVSDVVLFGFLSVFGFTFIHLLTTAERKNYAVEGSQCINLSAGMPMNRTFAERLKLLKVFGGILRERGISFQKMDTHIKKNVRRLCILAASFSESCSRICRFLV